MIRKKLAAAAAVCIMVFALGAAAAGAEAEYSWTAQNTVEISGAAASGKAGVNVVVQILKPGEDLSTVTPENMEDTVVYHDQIKTAEGGVYSVRATLDTDTEPHVALVREADGAALQTLVIEPNALTAEASLDAVGHMYYDCTKIPLNIKTSKDGIYNISVKLTDASGFRTDSVTKSFRSVPVNSENVAQVTLDLENGAMQYGVFHAECTISRIGGGSAVCTVQFSVSRGTEKGEENGQIGVTQHFFSMQKDSDINTELDMLQKAGIKLQRQSVYWDTFETEKGAYQFNARTQTYFDLLGEKRLDGIVQVYGGNSLYYPKNADGSYQRDENGLLIDYPPNTPEGLQAFGDYAYHLAAQTKDYADCYEIWNEYNIQTFNPRNLPAACYADMLKAVYGRIHEANPDAVVIGMAFAGFDEEALAWVKAVLEAGKGQVLMDAVSFHPYNQPETIESGQYIQQLKALFAEYGYEDIRVFVSETGYSSGRPATDELDQAKKEVRNLALLSDDAEQIYIYNAFEKQESPNVSEAEHGYGIIRGKSDALLPYHAKPAYVAIANFNKRTGNYNALEEESAGNGIYKVKFTKRDGTVCWMLWTVNAGGQAYMLDTGGITNVTEYDLFGNERPRSSADGKYILQLTDAPIYIEAKAAIEVKYIDDAGFTIQSLDDTPVIQVEAEVRIPTADTVLYAASYQDGRLIDCQRAEATAGRHTLLLSTEGADRVAVYYWRESSMRPVPDSRIDALVKQ